jgi:hypothetical protein
MRGVNRKEKTACAVVVSPSNCKKSIIFYFCISKQIECDFREFDADYNGNCLCNFQRENHSFPLECSNTDAMDFALKRASKIISIVKEENDEDA